MDSAGFHDRLSFLIPKSFVTGPTNWVEIPDGRLSKYMCNLLARSSILPKSESDCFPPKLNKISPDLKLNLLVTDGGIKLGQSYLSE